AYILTKLLNGDHQLMAASISMQTLLSVFTLALILALLQHYYV
ncbi:MAG: AEC family transporter, partial [Acinetobacter sp.]